LDSGANCNLISIQFLTHEEKQAIDNKTVIKITGFNKQSPTTHSLGKVEIPVHTKQTSSTLQFHVMPPHTLNYNLIGIHDIRQHFLKYIFEISTKEQPNESSQKEKSTPSSLLPPTPRHCYVTQMQEKSTKPKQQEKPTENILTYEQASQLYAEILTPTVEKPPTPKSLINQKWFKALWTLFPRLTMEHENLSEPSRLPHKFFVKLKPDAKPFISATYQMDKKRTDEMLKFMKKALEDNLIISVPCQYISAAFMIAKADPTKPYRCIIDYRKLNEDTERFDSTLPRIDALRNFAANGHIYSKLDISKAFHHMEVEEDTIPLLGFVSPLGAYSWRVAPMGTRCTPGQFTINLTFVVALATHHYNEDRKARKLPYMLQPYMCYIDDILLISDNEEEHKRGLYYLVYTLSRFHLTVNLDKCQLGMNSTTFLGHDLSNKTIQRSHKYVETFKRMPVPKTVRDLRRFLGISNFVRNYLPKIAHYQDSLNKIGSTIPKKHSKKVNIQWTKTLITDLAEIRNLVINAVANHMYNPKLPLFLVTDASQKAIGAMLYQTDETHKVLPLGFFSKPLTKAQRTYAALDIELLAIEQAILFFHFLLDCNAFTVYTDHKPLLTLLKAKHTLNKFRRRRLQFLSQYEMKVQHISGINNETADFLSRVLLKQDPEVSQINIALMHDSQFSTLLSQFTEKLKPVFTKEFQQKLFSAQKALRANHPQQTQIIEKHNLLYWTNPKGRQFIWLPQETFLNTLSLANHSFHHLSWKQTYYCLRRLFHFPKMRKIIREIIQKCPTCLRCKPKRHPILNPSPSYKAYEEPFQTLHLDHFHMGTNILFPQMTECLTIIDRATSLFMAIPLPRPNFLYTWLALQNHWISTHGYPLLLLSDNGSVFRSQEWTNHIKKLGIEHRFTLVANPACNGKVERAHRTMKSILKSYQQPTLWPFFLAQVVLAVNTHYDHNLQSTPAFRAYGFSLNTPGIPNWVNPDTDRFVIQKRQPTHKKEYISPDWNTATHAYIRILQRKHKLSPLYKGPFRIIDRNDRSMMLDIDGHLKRISYLHLHPMHFTPQELDPDTIQVSYPHHTIMKDVLIF